METKKTDGDSVSEQNGGTEVRDGDDNDLGSATANGSSQQDRQKKRNNWKKNIIKRKIMIPIHLLVLSFAIRLYESFLRCANDRYDALQSMIEEAESFFPSHPIDFTDEMKFKQTRNCWHEEFSSLVDDAETKYLHVVRDESYKGHCSTFHPTLFLLLDAIGFGLLLLIVGFFVFQDLNTPFGASRTSVVIAAHVMFDIVAILVVINFPIFRLLSASVHLSQVLDECVKNLKDLQRHALGEGFDIDRFYLYAHIWDGYRFGVPDPVTGQPVDMIYQATVFRYIKFLFLIAMILCAYLLYRASVKSMSLWRSAIPSVVCIGVVFPSSDEPNKLYRLGSGCIVDSRRGLILTNWHLFQKLGDDSEDYFFSSDRSESIHTVGMYSSASSTSGSMNRSESGSSRIINSVENSILTPPLSPSHKHIFPSFERQVSVGSESESSLRRQSSGMSQVQPSMRRRTVFETIEEDSIANSTQIIGDENRQSTMSIFSSETMRLESESSIFNSEFEPMLSGNDSAINSQINLPDLLLPANVRQESDMRMPDNERTSSLLSGEKSNASTQSHRKVHRHLTLQSKYSESFTDLFPDMKIVIGCTSRGHPLWEYSASFLIPSVESPSAEYAPFGLDLLILKIDKLVSFSKLTPTDSHSYTFESMEMEDITEIQNENLVQFKIADPWKEVVGDSKIKVLGYPASGGFTLSVLTGYFTGISYDHPAKLRGSWLNLNIALPHGGSGGAAVNAKGELLGIGTQTRGEMTNIRSIQEAHTFISSAKKIVDESKKKEKGEKDESCFICTAIQTVKAGSSSLPTASAGVLKKLIPRPWEILSNSSAAAIGSSTLANQMQ